MAALLLNAACELEEALEILDDTDETLELEGADLSSLELLLEIAEETDELEDACALEVDDRLDALELGVLEYALDGGI